MQNDLNPSPFRLGHQPALDGLRGVAILLILGDHSGLAPIGAMFGVDLFFVLSGFLITALLLQEWDRSQRIDLRAFYTRRLLRLAPALIAFVIAAMIYTQIHAPEILPMRDKAGNAISRSSIGIHREREAVIDGKELLGVAFYYHNWRMVGGHNTGLMFSPLWSLNIEEQFYLVWPALVLLALRWGVRRQTLARLTLALIGVVLLHRLRLWHGGVSPVSLYLRSDTRADGLLIGSWAAIVFGSGMLPNSVAFRRRLRFAVLPALALLTAFIGTQHMTYSSVASVGYTLIAGATAILILAMVQGCAPLLARCLSVAPLIYFGRISYGLYLWHWLAAKTIRHYFDPFNVTHQLGQIAVSITVASISFYVLERPFLRLKNRFHAKPPTIVEPPEALRQAA